MTDFEEKLLAAMLGINSQLRTLNERMEKLVDKLDDIERDAGTMVSS